MSHNGEPSSFTCHRMVDCKGGAAYTCPWGVPYLPSMMRWRKLQQAGAPLLKRFCQCHTVVQGWKMTQIMTLTKFWIWTHQRPLSKLSENHDIGSTVQLWIHVEKCSTITPMHALTSPIKYISWCQSPFTINVRKMITVTHTSCNKNTTWKCFHWISRAENTYTSVCLRDYHCIVGTFNVIH